MLTAVPASQPVSSCSVWLLGAALALPGCAGKPVEIGTLYQRLGQEPGIATLVDDLMVNIDQDPRIKDRFAKADVRQFKRALAAEICTIGSGPCSAQTPSVQTTLQTLKVTNEQFDAFIGDLAKTLDAHEVGPNTQREVLFAFKAIRGDVIDLGVR